MRMFDIVHAEFKRSGISQAELAARMRKDPGQLNRLLGAPGNWTQDTSSDLLWAISGARLVYALEYPMQKGRPESDNTMHHCLHVIRQTKYADKFPVGMPIAEFWIELEKMVIAEVPLALPPAKE